MSWFDFWVPDACGGYIDVSNGTIQSPSYPDLYPANKNCVWQIVAPAQYRITLNFTHFDLEGKNVSGAATVVGDTTRATADREGWGTVITC